MSPFLSSYSQISPLFSPSIFKPAAGVAFRIDNGGLLFSASVSGRNNVGALRVLVPLVIDTLPGIGFLTMQHDSHPRLTKQSHTSNLDHTKLSHATSSHTVPQSRALLLRTNCSLQFEPHLKKDIKRKPWARRRAPRKAPCRAAHKAVLRSTLRGPQHPIHHLQPHRPWTSMRPSHRM